MLNLALQRPRLLSFGFGIAFVVARGWWLVARQPDGELTLAVVCRLAVAGVLLCLALLRMFALPAVTSAWSPPGDRYGQRGLFPSACWVLLAGLAVFHAPQAGSPELHPLSAFFYWGVLLASPAALIRDAPRGSSAYRGLVAYRRTLTWCGLAVATAACGCYLWAQREHIGDVDFFYFVCCARDMFAGPGDAPHRCYRYFPGVYAFWRLAMRLGGSSLASLQTAYLAVLLANAALVSAIVFRGSRNAAAAVYSAVWYLVLCSRFEGFLGTAEPIATLPFLAGILIWGGEPLRGRTGYLAVTALAAGIGLALFTKQQAGLLAVGAVGLLPVYWWGAVERRPQASHLLLLPLLAAVTFAVAVLLEGRGFEPISRGLDLVASYERHGSWIANLWGQVRNDESAAAAALLLAGWLAMLLLLRPPGLVGQNWFQLVSFTTLAAAAVTCQYTSRGYYHYALLGLPCLVVGAVMAGAHLIPPTRAARQGNHLLAFGILGLAAFPLFYTGANPYNLHVWRLKPAAAEPRWHEQPRIADDLAALTRSVRPGEIMFVLPPRYSAPHFLLGTRSADPHGYRFQLPDLNTFDWSAFDAVLLITDGLGPPDEEFWDRRTRDEAARVLKRSGFEPATVLPSMTLYRRKTG